MPRRPDADLEGRIVDVAYRLWSQEGEHALTMRAVARAAKTTTPTVYQRFRDKKDLKHFLEERARHKLFDAVRTAETPIEICRNALAFISMHTNEYRLLTTDWGIRYARKMPMRSFEYLKQALARELGGETGKHDELAFQLFALVHGTAMLQPPEDQQIETAEALCNACLKACEALLRDAKREKRGSSSKKK